MLGVMLVSAGVHARTLTDITGRQVTIPDHPQRIVLGESRMLYSVALLTPGNPLQHIAGWPQDLKKYDPRPGRFLPVSFRRWRKFRYWVWMASMT